MESPYFPYRKLPGVRRGIISGSSLWLGSDHILHVKNTRFGEDYRRYYFNDIEAIYLHKTARFLPPPAVTIGVILGLIAILVLFLAGQKLAVEIGWVFVLSLAAYGLWVCVDRSCACFIQTGLGRDRLSCLHRVNSARAALDQIVQHVLPAQGPAQDYVPAEAPAEPPPEPAVQPRSKEQLFAWLTLPFILISGGVVMTLPVPIPDRRVAQALIAILAAAVFALLALIAGRGGARFRAIQVSLLALVVVSGMEVYALVLVNTYVSQQPLFARAAQGSTLMTSLAWGCHDASVWLARANIAIAFVTAMLLFRNPQRSVA